MTPPSEDVAILYESGQTHPGWKLLVAVGTGGSVVAAIAFLRWFERVDRAGLTTRGSVLLGMVVALVMALVVGTSRTVRRVAVQGGVLHLRRDPNVEESFPLEAIAATASEATVGGWSRDPAETLLLCLRDGRVLRYTLPDDADTPGLVHDLNARIAAEGRR